MVPVSIEAPAKELVLPEEKDLEFLTLDGEYCAQVTFTVFACDDEEAARRIHRVVQRLETDPLVTGSVYVDRTSV
jgi:hypothetical protein